MMSGDQAMPQYAEEESLFYKIYHRLSRLYEVLRESKSSIAKERADLQELISDISHQVKTPICKPEKCWTPLCWSKMYRRKNRKNFFWRWTAS